MGNSNSKGHYHDGYDYNYKGHSTLISDQGHKNEGALKHALKAKEAEFRVKVDENLRIKAEKEIKAQRIRREQLAFQKEMKEAEQAEAEQQKQQFLALMQMFAGNAQASISSREESIISELRIVREELQEFQQKNKELMEQLEEMKRKQEEAEEELNNIGNEQAEVEQKLTDGEIDEEEARIRNTVLEQRKKEAEARKEEALVAFSIAEQELAESQKKEEEIKKNLEQQKEELEKKVREYEQTRQTLNQTAQENDIDYQIPEFQRKELDNLSDISSLSFSETNSDDTWSLPPNNQTNSSNNLVNWKNYQPYLKWGIIGFLILIFLYLAKKFINIFI